MNGLTYIVHCVAVLLLVASLVSFLIRSLEFMGVPLFIAAFSGLILNVIISLWILRRR